MGLLQSVLLSVYMCMLACSKHVKYYITAMHNGYAPV